MHQQEKPSSDQIIIRSLTGGLLWGIAWAIICYLCIVVLQGDLQRNFRDVLTHGVFFGLVMGCLHRSILAGKTDSISLTPVYVLAVIFACIVWFFTPFVEYFLANMVAVVIGSWLIRGFVLNTKTGPAKEKHKNA